MARRTQTLFIGPALLLALTLSACTDDDTGDDEVADSTSSADTTDATGTGTDTKGTGTDTTSTSTDTTGTDTTSTDTTTDGGGLPPSPLCVWNQAYQENYEPDSVDAILAGAQGCYVLLDPFADEDARAAIPAIAAAGNIVGCYISVGTCEDWRDDFAQMQGDCVDQQWGEWPGEYFVDTPGPGLVAAMNARIDQMAAWGCDMVEFDNMDWAYDEDYRAQYGFTVSEAEAEAYVQGLCASVHGQGMWCMAKSTARGAEGFEGGTFESYVDDLDWWEHAELQGFLDGGGIGLIVHYDEVDCDGVYADYQASYGDKLSFICEDPALQGYKHYN